MTRRFTKMTVVLAVAALCCFMFAGMAAAAGQFSFTTQSNPIDGSATNYVKADHTYNFSINVTGITAPVEQFTDNRPPVSSGGAVAENKLMLNFPQGFCANENFSENSVSAYLTIGGQEYGPIPVIPEIALDEYEGECGDTCSVADQVYFTIERQFLPDNLSNPAYVTAVRIEGFKVVTPENPGQFLVCVKHTQTACGIDACANLNVVKTVGEITLDDVKTDCLYAGGQVTICGTMYDTCGDLWDETTWPIIVELKEKVNDPKCGKACYTYNDVYVANEANFGTNCFGADTCITEDEGRLVWAQVVHVTTAGPGEFCATLDLPTWLHLDSNVEYVITARTPEVRDEKAAFDSPIEWKFGDQPESKVPAESIEDNANSGMHVKRGSYTLNLSSQQGAYTTKAHAWLKSNEYGIDEINPGNPYFIESTNLGTQIDVDEYYPIEICLVDKFCNATPNKLACGDPLPPLKVELRAVDCTDPTQIAGKYYKRVYGQNGPYLETEDADHRGQRYTYEEIVYTEILGGEYCAKVYFKATKVGSVTLQQSAIFGPTDYHVSTTGQCCLEVNSEAGCVLEVTNLVLADKCDSYSEYYDYDLAEADRRGERYERPKAGWPVKISLYYPPTANIRVELLDEDYNILTADEATWDLIAITDADPNTGRAAYLAYDAEGQYASGDQFVHNTGVPYNNAKSDFFVYFKDACNKVFYVKVVDVDQNVYKIARVGRFAPSTDLVRILEPQKWQILSTPKVLAGDGDMKTLLPSDGTIPYTEILTYKDNQWMQVLPTEQLEPLYAYLLNMRQNYCPPGECEKAGSCGEQKNVYAKYVFARAVDPAYAMPATRLLSKGANLIGPAFNEQEVSPYSELLGDYVFGGTSIKDPDCFEYDGGCCNCDDCQVPERHGIICPDQLFQPDSLGHLTATFCDGCTAIYTYGGVSGGECRNPYANLAWFTTAALGGNNIESWLADPINYAFNGDGYWAYLSQSQTMTGAAQLELINITNEEIYGE